MNANIDSLIDNANELHEHDRGALRWFHAVATTIGAELDVMFINRRADGRYRVGTELHAAFEVDGIGFNLVYYRNAYNGAGYIGYLVTDDIDERNATNTLLRARLGMPWCDFRAA